MVEDANVSFGRRWFVPSLGRIEGSGWHGERVDVCKSTAGEDGFGWTEFAGLEMAVRRLVRAEGGACIRKSS